MNLKRSCLRTCVTQVHPLVMTFQNFAMSLAHLPCSITLSLCSSFRELSGVSVDDVFLLVRSRERKRKRGLWIDRESRAELLCFSQDSPWEIKHRTTTFVVLVFFCTCRNSIILELLQSASGMYNFFAYYGKFTGFSRGILFSREYCPRYSWIELFVVPFSFSMAMENERLCAVNYIFCKISTNYISVHYLSLNDIPWILKHFLLKIK